MPLAVLVHAAQQALLVVVLVSLPVLAIGAVLGLIVAALQAATQIQDPTLAHLPRMIVVAAALVWLGPWMGHTIVSFAQDVFSARP